MKKQRVKVNGKEYFYDTSMICVYVNTKKRMKESAKKRGMTYDGYLNFLMNKDED